MLMECKNLGMTYWNDREGKELTALAGFDLSITEGEFLAVLGPSGCGKSTLLNLVAGFLKPTSGEVLLSGKLIHGPGHDRGVVFQEYALFPWLSVVQNVAFGLIERGIPSREASKRSAPYIDLVGLKGFEHRLPHQLSGGMRQRASLARVLVNEPRILLLDEPFAAVDAQTRAALQREMETIWLRTHQTILLITHSVDEAVFLGDRVIVMSPRPGRIKEEKVIQLERPRDLTSDSFNEYRRWATRAIEGALGARTAT